MTRTNGFLIYTGRVDIKRYEYFTLPELACNNGQRLEDIVGKVKRHIYEEPLFKAKAIGGIFIVEFDDEKVYYNKARLPESIWKNQDDRAKWQLTTRASDLKAKEKKDVMKNQYQELLQPIHEAYAEANYQDRALILAEVLRVITRGRGMG